MHRLLLILCVFLLCEGQAQKAYLFVKRGVRKVKSFPEGSYMKLQTTNGMMEGYMTRLYRDSVYIGSTGFPASSITKVYDIQPGMGIRPETFLYTSMGIVLSTAALRIVENNSSGVARTPTASPAVLGSSGLALKALLHKLKYGRAKYRIGRRFRVQVFDLRPY
ncbi:MAG TPA: hypothetical protein VGB46_04460 [Flavisolibacter sp.]|jgi:hypothetical protein